MILTYFIICFFTNCFCQFGLYMSWLFMSQLWHLSHNFDFISYYRLISWFWVVCHVFFVSLDFICHNYVYLIISTLYVMILTCVIIMTFYFIISPFYAMILTFYVIIVVVFLMRWKWASTQIQSPFIPRLWEILETDTKRNLWAIRLSSVCL